MGFEAVEGALVGAEEVEDDDQKKPTSVDALNNFQVAKVEEVEASFAEHSACVPVPSYFGASY